MMTPVSATEMRSLTPKATFGSNSVDPLQQRAVALERQAKAELEAHDYGAAERDYQKAIDTNPRNPFLYRGLATLYDAEGRSKDAYNAWRKVLIGAPGGVSSDQSDPYVLAHFGELSLQMGDKPSAERSFALAIQNLRSMFGSNFELPSDKQLAEQSPRVLAHYNAGIEMSLGGQKEKANKELALAVRLAPNFGVAKLALGQELCLEGRQADAEPMFEAVEKSPDPELAKFALTHARLMGLDHNMTTTMETLPNGKVVIHNMTVEEYNRTRAPGAPALPLPPGHTAGG